MSTPLVSVVMSVYNGERFLRESAESILNQSFRDFEFIIIDNGSTDGSGQILDSYQNSDARVAVYHQENRGLVDALNRGCSLARGQYIARMDADDVAIVDRLMWQTDFLKKHPEIGLVGGAVELIDEAGRPLGVRRYPTSDHEIKSQLSCRNVIWHPTVLVRREILASVCGYRNILYAEDYDLWLRIADQFGLANFGALLLRYRVHPDQISSSKRGLQRMSALAVRGGALARNCGRPDPLDSMGEIASTSVAALFEETTPAVLAEIRARKGERQNTLIRAYLQWIVDLCDIGECLDTDVATETLLTNDWNHVERWALADVRFVVAQLYWRQRRLTRSFLMAAWAIMTRPSMICRTFRPLRRLALALASRVGLGGGSFNEPRSA